MRTRNTFVVGTRTSQLAINQTTLVVRRLVKAFPGVSFPVRTFSTTGDRLPDRPLGDFRDRGIFTTDIEQALLAREIDLAVHSFKDLPVNETSGLIIAAVPDRADVRDVLVARGGRTLRTLPHGATVGTSSLSRTGQLLALRPDLRICPIRGSVDNRVQKVFAGEFDATILAAAGLSRLGLENRISDWFTTDQMTPFPAQAALAVQCRSDDEALVRMLNRIDNPEFRRAAIAERSFYHELGAGLPIPVGAFAESTSESEAGSTQITLFGKIISVDGRSAVRVRGSGLDPVTLGQELAAEALVRGGHSLIRIHERTAAA